MSPKADYTADIIEMKSRLESDSGIYASVADMQKRLNVVEIDLIKYKHTTMALWKFLAWAGGILFAVGTFLYNHFK
jgi:hypothetical protein